MSNELLLEFDDFCERYVTPVIKRMAQEHHDFIDQIWEQSALQSDVEKSHE